MEAFIPAISPWIELTRIRKLAGPMMLFWPFAWSLTMIAHTLSTPLETYGFAILYGFVGCAVLHRFVNHIGTIYHLSMGLRILSYKLEHGLFASFSYMCPVGAGCIWNDILDRDFDRKVERTKNRPLANGRVSVAGALVFLSAHLIALTAMIWNLNHIAFRLGIMAIYFLPGIYPLMKRITFWPQAWLGLALNIGVPLSWAALTAGFPPSCLALSVGAWSWTIWYDTIYACQDKKDDKQAGVKSTALLFGQSVKPILALFGTILVCLLSIAGFLNGQSVLFYVVSVGGAAFHLAKQLWEVDLDKPAECWKTFEKNGVNFGFIVWAGLFCDYFFSKGLTIHI